MDLLSENKSVILLRKYRNMLSICALGVFIFGIWSVVKFFMYYLLFDDYYSISYMDSSQKTMFILSCCFLYAIDFSFRLIACLGALKASKTHKSHYKYLIVVMLMFIVSVLTVILILSGLFVNLNPEDIWDILSSLLVEATSAFTLLEMFIYSLKERKLEYTLEISNAN